MRPGDLVERERFGIIVGAASTLVDRLERDGLVVQQPDAAHRRSSLAPLTPALDRLQARLDRSRRA